MKKSNDELAREQLDRSRLEKLAEREKKLAEKTAELAAKNPLPDPAAKEQTEKLRQQQDEVVAELDRTAQKSETLKQALEQAREEQVREMAERARELAVAQRDLMRAEAETQRNPKKSGDPKSADQSPRQLEREGEGTQTQPAPDDLVGELIRQQREVARKADELAGNVAHEHGDESAPSQHARQAEQAARETARQLQSGALTRARDAGEKTAEQLRQLAARLARSPRDIRQSYDSFGKARQLDQRQEEINRRLQTLASDSRARPHSSERGSNRCKNRPAR